MHILVYYFMKETLSLPVWVLLFVCCKTQMKCMTCRKQVWQQYHIREMAEIIIFLSDWYHFQVLICMHKSISIRVITRCFFFQRCTLKNLTGCGSISIVSLGYLWYNWSKKFLTDNNSIFCPANSSIHETFPTVKWCHILLYQRLYVPNAVLISIRNQKK